MKKFKNYMTNLRKGYLANLTNVMQNEKMSAKEQKSFLNCMCRNTGDGMLGSHIDGKGICLSCGPLSCWPIPISTKKSGVLKCLNQIARERYSGDQAIFKEFHKLDEETYKKMHQLIEESNSKVVEDRVKKIYELIKTMDQDYEKKAFKAANIFNLAKEFMSQKDKKEIKSILIPRLRNIAHLRMSKRGDIKGAIEAIKTAQTLDEKNDALQRDLAQYKKWLEPWKRVVNEYIPDIKKDIDRGELKKASQKFRDIATKTSNGTYPPTSDPRWLNLSKFIDKKKIEISKKTQDTIKNIDDLVQKSDPKSALKLIDDFPKSWENYSDMVESKRESVVDRISNATSQEKAGDTSQENGDIYQALSHYKKSQELQKNRSVKKKYDELKDRIAKAQKQLQKGRRLWRDGELQQAIGEVTQAQKLVTNNKAINKTLKAMHIQKKMMDETLKKADRLIEYKKLDQARDTLRKAKRINSKYPPYVETIERLNGVKKSKKKHQEKLATKTKTTKIDLGIKPSSLVGRWSFGRSVHYGKSVDEHLCDLTLTSELVEGVGYKIKSCHPNESYWILEGERLLFVAQDKTVTTKFIQVEPDYWEGAYIGNIHSNEKIMHYLKRLKSIDKSHTDKADNASINKSKLPQVDTKMVVKSSKDTIQNISKPISVYNGTDGLSLTKSTFEPKEKITLSFKASPNYPKKSWIGMFKADLPHDGMSANNNKELAYYYIEKLSNGTFEFVAPTKEGDYDFRMFESSNGLEVVMVKFKVRELTLDRDKKSKNYKK
ncbi:hypothetical protein MNB_SV-6-1431 [hydrothermal vent metagenome]|uniref:Uncharacterized protein n=1 Tax=hydrothermal vent metagenome TaxID=652676 RepID=A0A1W1BGZ0_9ZZZZ